MIYHYHLLLVATRTKYQEQHIESFEIDTGQNNYDEKLADGLALRKAQGLSENYPTDRPDKDQLIVCRTIGSTGCPRLRPDS